MCGEHDERRCKEDTPCGMLHQLRPPKTKSPPTLVSNFLTTISSSAPSWVAANQLYRRHPRLLLLERCRSLRHLKSFLAHALVSGLFRNPFVASRLLHGCAALDLSFAASVFDRVEKPNLFSWNIIIRASAASARHPSAAAFSLYGEMRRRGELPDEHTFPFLLKACRAAPELAFGRLVHAHAVALGFDSDPFVQSALLSMYCSCGSLGDARRLFDEMPERDVVSWTAMVSGIAEQGCHEEALEVFNDMMRCDSGVCPNVATMVSAMSACASLGSLEHARGLHAYIEKVGLDSHVFIRNSLIDMYAKCGSVINSIKIFERMETRDLHSWTAMITGLASHGHGKDALIVFSEMQEMGFAPDSTTFIAVLSACSHAGLVDEGIRLFDSMQSVYMIKPDLKHYGCMVDLFSRAGLLSRAYDFVLKMPMEPNLAILGSLLSACRLHNKLELGELVVKKIQLVCEYRGGSHILLSNMYADQQRWHGVALVREATKENENKPPGRSWIEVRGVVHEFVVEDRMHMVAKEMHLVLNGLEKLMEGL